MSRSMLSLAAVLVCAAAGLYGWGSAWERQEPQARRTQDERSRLLRPEREVQEARTAPARNEAGEGEPAAAEALRRVEGLESELRELARQVQRLASMKREVSGAGPPPPASEELPLSPEALRWTRAERDAELAELLSSEAEDPLWKQDLGAELEMTMEALEIRGSRVRSVTCGTSFCKVDALHDDQESFEQFAEIVFNLPGIAGASVSVSELPNRTLNSLAYLVHPESDPNHPALN